MTDEHNRNFILNYWRQYDRSIILSFSLLFCIGIILVITASPFVAVRIGVDPFYFIKNHIIYMLLSIVTIFVVSVLGKKHVNLLIVTGFISSVCLMVLILLFAPEVKGAKRWFYLFGFSLQASEFMKVFLPFTLAMIWQYFSTRNTGSLFIYLVTSILISIIIFLLLLQPDLGMTVVVILVFATILFITGINYIWIVALLLLGSILIVSSYYLFPHVNYRLNAFLFEEKSYQITKALDAITNGKLFGTGAGQGVLKQYLPDSHTDFIFSIGAEEFGLSFSIFLLMIYFNIIFRMFTLIHEQKSIFNMIALSGAMILFTTQVMIHVASNINLIPTKGMTLPMISYGGSSMLSMAILIGLVLNLGKKDIQNIVLKVK